MLLFAVHIADGVLLPYVLALGFIGLVLGLAIALFRLPEEVIPRIGMVAAILFIASIIHIPIGVGTVHLLLNGIGFLLVGIRVVIAIPIVLLLQALLLSHGGLLSLGINACVLGLPMLLLSLLVPLLKKRLPLTSRMKRYLLGGSISFLAVLMSLTLHYLVLRFGCIEGQDLQVLATFDFLWHLPVLVVETILGGLLLDFLFKVKPELLHTTLPGTMP